MAATAAYDFDHGSYHRDIVAASGDARLWFDRGMVWAFGFHHEEAIACFERAAAADPTALMPHVGVACCHAPNYNFHRGNGYYESAAQTAAGGFPSAQAQSAAVDRCAALLAVAAGDDGDAPCSQQGGSSDIEFSLAALLVERRDALAVVMAELGAAPASIDTAASAVAARAAAIEHAEHSFASGLGRLSAAHPADRDLQYWHAEALLLLSPWNLWTADGTAVVPGVAEGRAVLEAALAAAPSHAGLCHLYIHCCEMHPDLAVVARACAASDQLRGGEEASAPSAPDAGHLLHMPSHIDVRLGRWGAAERTSDAAVAADARTAAGGAMAGFYTGYCAHNSHMLVYAAMMAGRLTPALQACESLERLAATGVLRSSAAAAGGLEPFVAVRAHVLLRFGQWEALLAPPPPRVAADTQLFCTAFVTHLYARAVALAIVGRHGEAAAAAAAFEECRTTTHAKGLAARQLHNVPVPRTLAVASRMLAGELGYQQAVLLDKGAGASQQQRRLEESFAALREAAALDDALPYDEPWGWMMPVRHALGALLLAAPSGVGAEGDEAAAARAAEALAVFEADLSGGSSAADGTGVVRVASPGNVWALRGRCTALKRTGAPPVVVEEAERVLAAALADADVAIEAGCACATASSGSSCCSSSNI